MEVTSETFVDDTEVCLAWTESRLNRRYSSGRLAKIIQYGQYTYVLPMFYEAVYASYFIAASKCTFCCDCKALGYAASEMQTMRTNEFFELNKKLHAVGVRPLVVKGIICRNLYPQPDYRQSGDEDVLVSADQFGTCHLVIMEYGM